ncbi:MAG: SHOCT domain-containing protein [Nitrososphaeraceae archaeon]|nr:SHOCT domain-containing protein [Nitrososphaeraceae archaeon]
MAWRVARRRGIAGGLVVGGVTGAAVAGISAKRQYEKMATAKAQQEQISQAQAQAAQATQAAQAAQQQAAQAAQQQQGSGQGKKDIYQELEKLAGLKQQGIITEEEFQQMKSRLLSSA